MPPQLRTRQPTGQVAWPLVLIEGEEKAGKAQPLDARIATPYGWTTMGDLRPGSAVIGSDGHPTTVREIHERGTQPVYRLTTSDGASTVAAADHLWRVWTTNDRHRRRKNGQPRNHPGRVWTTETIAEQVRDGEVVHLPMVRPVAYSIHPDLPVDPYALGLLLGDGGMSARSALTFTTDDPELADALRLRLLHDDRLVRRNHYGYGVVGAATMHVLRDLGLHPGRGDVKFIPEPYLRASETDRLALLQGLLDTDGGMERVRVTYTTTSERLARDVGELVESLGGTAKTSAKQPYAVLPDGARVAGRRAWRITVRLPAHFEPFRLTRKREAWQAARPRFATGPIRTVKEVAFVGYQECRCITVAAEDHLYVTDHFMVTHNSFAALGFSSCPKVGRTFVVELDEPTADEYKALGPFEIVDHNGTYSDVLGQIEAACAEPTVDGKPNVIILDSGTALWDLLKDWASMRARNSKKSRDILAKDPDAEIDVSMNYWNDAKDRWYKVINALRLWPGLAIIIARGKEVAKVVNGAPVAGQTDYSIQAEKGTQFACSAWVRMTRPHKATLIAVRSLHIDVPERGLPLPETNPIEHLVFEILGAGGDFQTPHLTRGQIGTPAAQAKARLLDKLVKAGIPESDAIGEARGLWHLAGLEGIAEITDGQWERVLTDAEERLAVVLGPPKPEEPAADDLSDLSDEIRNMPLSDVVAMLQGYGQTDSGTPAEMRRRLAVCLGELDDKAGPEPEGSADGDESTQLLLRITHDVDQMAPKDVKHQLGERGIEPERGVAAWRSQLVRARFDAERAREPQAEPA